MMTRLLTMGGLLGASFAQAQEPEARPNVLVVVVDDAGYTDFGAYGGDARTPVIDSLAEQGARFSQFHATPQCAPSRAMLLTGADNHEVGIGTINETMTESLEGLPGYAMKLDADSLTLAERLRDAGYQTFATGKWGIGKPGSSLPHLHGFEQSHVLDASGADNWEQKPYLPLYDTAPWYENGEPITLPEDYYSSEYIVDRTIDLIDQADPDRPFFAYMAFQAIHAPLQVSRSYSDRYRGVFDRGWDVLRAERAARAEALGLVPVGTKLAAMPGIARPWEALDADEQARYAGMMEVSAGMLEAMDHHLGRLLDHLAAAGTLDDTLIVVVSDNGPENSELPAEHEPVRGRAKGPLLERLGEKGTTATIGPEWATVSAAPLSLFKFYTSEGGMRVPLVIAGPGVPSAEMVHARAHITDVLPTVLDLVGVPLTPVPDGGPPVRGRSLRPAMVGEVEEVYGPEDAVGYEVAGNAALYRGSYKLVRLTPPEGDGTWRLYDLDEDPGESTDLSQTLPEIAAGMRAAYDDYALRAGVAELPDDYDPVAQIRHNAIDSLLGRYAPWLLGVLLLGLGGLAMWWRRRAT